MFVCLTIVGIDRPKKNVGPWKKQWEHCRSFGKTCALFVEPRVNAGEEISLQ